jgi:hypothetical protein
MVDTIVDGDQGRTQGVIRGRNSVGNGRQPSLFARRPVPLSRSASSRSASGRPGSSGRGGGGDDQLADRYDVVQVLDVP